MDVALVLRRAGRAALDGAPGKPSLKSMRAVERDRDARASQTVAIRRLFESPVLVFPESSPPIRWPRPQRWVEQLEGTAKLAARSTATSIGEDEILPVDNQVSIRRLRTAFGYLNRFMVALWRLGLGGWVNFWPAVGGRVMVLVNIGRRTGLERRTPLNYASIGGDIYCVSGFGRISDWYKSIVENPHVEIWLPDGWWAGVVTDVSDSESRLTVLRQVLIASGFASYLAGIWPRSISDADLAQATADYRVLRIERTQSLAAKSGPGDLSWAWPIVTLVLLVALLVC